MRSIIGFNRSTSPWSVVPFFLAVAALGLCGCVGPGEERTTPNCADLTLLPEALDDVTVVAHKPLEALMTERAPVESLAVSFLLRVQGEGSFRVGDPIPFVLEIANETDQAVVLYVPRSPITLGIALGAFEVKLWDGEHFFGTCGAAGGPNTPDLLEDFIELPARSKCEWPFTLDWEEHLCEYNEPPGPGQYALWYRYFNVTVGPPAPAPDESTGELFFYDVRALLGIKRSNRAEFTIVESQSE